MPSMALLGSAHRGGSRPGNVAFDHSQGPGGPHPSQHAILAAAAAAAAAQQQSQQVFYPVQQPQQPSQEVQPDRPIGYGAFGVVW